MVPLIRDKRAVSIHAQRRMTAQNIHRNKGFLDQRLGGLPTKGNDLDWQWKIAQGFNLFADVRDNNHLIRCRRHDLLL